MDIRIYKIVLICCLILFCTTSYARELVINPGTDDEIVIDIKNYDYEIREDPLYYLLKIHSEIISWYILSNSFNREINKKEDE